MHNKKYEKSNPNGNQKQAKKNKPIDGTIQQLETDKVENYPWQISKNIIEKINSC